uniref:PDZ domain-containing protein n=1 Tax=Euplotes harpa TaxID=151035 RepID=A0A7S3NF43_9SPIT|mmetsp:Transcript_5656/g.6666  ORF Transcript_5656/g.6666 Transcript_5656/m.6666 type:complete len:131 (+) Transcript_5656:56-448(+)
MLDSNMLKNKVQAQLEMQQRLAIRFKFLTSFMKHNSVAYCDDDSHADIPYVGMSIRSLIDRPGMTVLLVNSESPAAKGGIKVGDIIMKINEKEVNKIEDYYKAMGDVRPGDIIHVVVERYHEFKDIVVAV